MANTPTTDIRAQLTEARSQEYLTVDQFALLAQYHPKSVYRKIDRDEIPGVVRIGGGIRIERSTALQIARERRENSRR